MYSLADHASSRKFLQLLTTQLCLLGFCLFGVHVIPKICQIGVPAFPLPPSLHGAVMGLSLGSVALNHEETLFLPRTSGPLGSGPPVPFIQIPNSARSVLCCGRQHSQAWVLDPAQPPCLKAAGQDSRGNAEAVG